MELPSDVQLMQAPTNETDRMISNDLDPDTVLVAGSVTRPKRVIIVELQQAWDRASSGSGLDTRRRNGSAMSAPSSSW